MDRGMGRFGRLCVRVWSGRVGGVGLLQRCEKSTLAYEELVVPGKGSEEVKTAMVVHGLMGSGRNWRTVSKRLASDIVDSSPPGSPGM